MSDITNVITKQKQFFYNAGVNSSNVDAAVDSLNDQLIVVTVGDAVNTNTVNTAAVGAVAPFACKLQSAYYVPNYAIANTATDEVLITVSCNGSTAATYNSNASADGALAAGAIHTMSVTAANSALAAGEKINIAMTAEDATNNNPYGVVTFLLRRQ